MKILLTENVSKLGKAGEIVEVAKGYAMNFLIPQKKGVEATKAILNEWETKKKGEAVRKERSEQEAIEKAKELEGKTITVSEKAGESGKLFGAVTAQDVADALLAQLGLEVDKKKIDFDEDIKAIGDYQVTVRLHQNAVARVNMTVLGDA